MKGKILIILLFIVAVVITTFFLNSQTVGTTPPENLGEPVAETPINSDSEEIINEETATVSSSNTTPLNMSPSLSPVSTTSEPSTDPVSEPISITPITPLVTMAWIYPSEPGCDAATEYRDGRKIDILKPEFFTINGGELILLDNTNSSCNGYSKSFVSDLKRHSAEQYVTISSSNSADMETFLTSALASSDDIGVLVSFVIENNLTGIELDFEDFGGWSQKTYKNYLTFVERLGTALHENNKKLMLDGPAIANSTEQGWFTWRYEDFTSLPVDYIVVMAYDYQFDHGTGQPVAPLEWIKKVTSWASARYPANRLSVGIPSYGYEGTLGKRPLIRTYNQLKNKTGFNSALRDKSSGEMTWQSGNTIYFFQDQESLRQKIKAVSDTGINSISIWHLGGNVWYK